MKPPFFNLPIDPFSHDGIIASRIGTRRKGVLGRRPTTMVLSLIALAVMAAWATAAEPAATPTGNEPGLPNVLIIGDSVSFGFTGPVKDILKGKANIIYPANVQASGTVPVWCQWVVQHPPPNGGKWDVIHFNWGLWDVSHDWRLDNNNKLSGKAGTTPVEYEKNLRVAVAILKTTGAKLIFATTTPLGPAKVNKYDSVPERNEIAKKIMQENGIPIDDLYSRLYPNEASLLLDDGIHQNQKGNEILAKSVAESIELQLPKK